MSDITLERIKRLTEATADMMESTSAQARHVARSLERIEAGLAALTVEMRALASEQVLLGNRIENAFSRALRADIRIGHIEDAEQAP